jgi:hypothetical protein
LEGKRKKKMKKEKKSRFRNSEVSVFEVSVTP